MGEWRARRDDDGEREGAQWGGGHVDDPRLPWRGGEEGERAVAVLVWLLAQEEHAGLRRVVQLVRANCIEVHAEGEGMRAMLGRVDANTASEEANL